MHVCVVTQVRLHLDIKNFYVDQILCSVRTLCSESVFPAVHFLKNMYKDERKTRKKKITKANGDVKLMGCVGTCSNFVKRFINSIAATGMSDGRARGRSLEQRRGCDMTKEERPA